MRKLLFAALLLPLTALAEDAQAILGKVDDAISRFTDQEIHFEVQNLKPGAKNPQSMGFFTKVKGGKSYTEFTAPGDLKGTRVLLLDATKMWVYLPDFGKVRRVASHTTEQGFMGTTLTQQDMGVLAYAPIYAAKLNTEDDDTWTLDLTAKEGAEVMFKTLRMVIEKKRQLPLKTQFMNAEGEVIRTETRGEYICNGDTCTPGVMRMTDHARGDAWTEMRAVDVKLNTGISDDVFTPRTLQLGL